MLAIYEIFLVLSKALTTVIIVWFIISMLFAFNVVSRDNHFLWEVNMTIDRLLTPILAPIRRVLPNTGAIDFSPLVLILTIQIIEIILRRALLG